MANALSALVLGGEIKVGMLLTGGLFEKSIYYRKQNSKLLLVLEGTLFLFSFFLGLIRIYVPPLLGT